MTTSLELLDDLETSLARTMQADRFALRKLAASVVRARREGKPFEKNWERFSKQLARSQTRFEARQQALPKWEYDPELPITAKREEILAAIRNEPVVVICGETGSGKSTQLPKFCLEAGRGIAGWIGHTQPRRIAARSIASRVADELHSAVGGHVGYKVRFTDTIGEQSFIKLMTDGILLAETQQDRFLDQYDTLIIDEAHERSLNIDFLLGYLRRLLNQRRDLRLIITSATIDAARFAAHFDPLGRPAPVIEVSGRTYPVETRYRPVALDDEQEAVAPRHIAQALDELCAAGPGDILVFLPTEREIRETTRQLRGWSLQRDETIEILPLYARLSAAEQNKVFQPGKARRIVLATNVAESSLTVPRIHSVIDTGTARVSRYSPRAKVQRLPIEPISRASADQRQGRCGRLGPGVCIRLYSEDDYLARDRYTTPEIRRTNLASVILRMLALRLGDVDRFPFLDSPTPEAVRDGYRTLFELGAIDAGHQLTDLGQRMSRLPVDPRIARMILAAEEEHCVHEVLVIASALEVQDPRLRPPDKEALADERHAVFQDANSDFLSYLKLWDFFHQLKVDLSRSRFRKACEQNFLSLVRLHEWQEVHRQLLQLVRESQLPVGPRQDRTDAIHRALLAGLLANVAMRTETREFLGAGNTKSYLWPGSSLVAQKPKWLMSAEVIETTRRYLRTAARIDPQWIEPLAHHLVKRSYHDPHWSRKRETVLALEKVTLFGLPIVNARPAPYAKVNRPKTRQLFIQHALVEGDYDCTFEFFRHNRDLIIGLATFGARARSARYLVSDAEQFAFYESRLPPEICDGASLRRWVKHASPDELQTLMMTVDHFLPDLPAQTDREAYPDAIRAGGLQLDLDYRYAPGEADDGMSITLPKEALGQLDDDRLQWLVPGLLEEKIAALIRGLPKNLRRSLIPAPDKARRAAEIMPFGEGPFLATLAATLSEIAGEPIPAQAFDLARLPAHLQINVKIQDESGNILAQSRDLETLRQELGIARSVDQQAGRIADPAWDRTGITQWEWDALPESIEMVRGGLKLRAFPTLVDERNSVRLQLLDQRQAAARIMQGGLRRLFALQDRRELRAQVEWLPKRDRLEMIYSSMRQSRTFREHVIDWLAQKAFLEGTPLPRTRDQFQAALTRGRERMLQVVAEVAKLLPALFEPYQTLRQLLAEAPPRQADAAYADLRNQLQSLISDEFLLETPPTSLAQLPRYLQAMLVRIDRLKTGGAGRDAQAAAELRPYLEAFRQRQAEHEQRGLIDPELIEFRWLLEEFRVSLFAQQLGTAQRVSPKRLEAQWQKVAY